MRKYKKENKKSCIDCVFFIDSHMRGNFEPTFGCFFHGKNVRQDESCRKFQKRMLDRMRF